MSKVIGVTKPIYELCKVLEEVEDKIVFSAFYSFAEILESYYFCPGFYFDKVYYEIKYDNKNVLQVVDFGIDEREIFGNVLTEEQITELTEMLKKL